MAKVAIILLVIAAVYGIEGVAIPNNPNIAFPINYDNSAWQLLQGSPAFDTILQQIQKGGNTNGAAITTFIDSNGKKTSHLVYSEDGKVSTMDFRK